MNCCLASIEFIDYFPITYKESLDTFVEDLCLYLKLDVMNCSTNLDERNLLKVPLEKTFETQVFSFMT